MVARQATRRVGRGAARVILALALVGCDAATATPFQPSVSPTEAASEAPSPSQPDQTTDPLVAIAAGVWRAVPVDVSRAFSAPFEAGCRAAEPALSGLIAALVDVRGANVVQIVFAHDHDAYLCRARVDAPATPDAVTKLDVAAGALPDDGIDIALYTLIGNGDSARTILVGRVGTIAAHVIAGFDNETYIFGAQSGGWYALWWPSPALMNGVSSTDKGHVVLTEVNATRT